MMRKRSLRVAALLLTVWGAACADSNGKAGNTSDGGTLPDGEAGDAAELAMDAGEAADAAIPKVEIDVPESVIDGDVQLTCTALCGEKSCSSAHVFVSACAREEPGTCYAIAPVDSATGAGNTFLVRLDATGQGDVVEEATCSKGSDAGAGLPVDLLFVIDTSSSMAGAISGLLASVDGFVNGLASEGVNARIGGIAFAQTAPLETCVKPDAPLVPFTDKFGAGTEQDPDSFNYWISNLSSTHCGDYGGSDIPEDALDAIGFALGHDPLPDAGVRAIDGFAWDPASLHVMVLISDATQHERANGQGVAHFDFDALATQLKGFGVVHVVAPNYGCHNTPAVDCACNVTPRSCDADCACDLQCPTPGCPADVRVGFCDDPSSACDIDCAHRNGSLCDLNPGRCDVATGATTEACADDVDCANGTRPGSVYTRRCEPVNESPYVDLGRFASATGGAFTTLPTDGRVDLTQLPLTHVLSATQDCDVPLAADTTSVRCVYRDGDGHSGELTVDLH